MADFGWIDKFSRAVFTDITIFNPNKNLFTRISIVVEFSETGRVQKKVERQSFQLYNYVGPGAVWNIVSEIAVILFIFLFMKREFTKIRKTGFCYFSGFWNLIEFTKIIVGITAIIMYLTKTYYVKTSLKNLTAREGEFINFQRVAIWNEIFIYCVGFICFSSILYVINLLRFNVKMSALALVLKNSTEELMSFSVIFFILFFAFASFAYIGNFIENKFHHL